MTKDEMNKAVAIDKQVATLEKSKAVIERALNPDFQARDMEVNLWHNHKADDMNLVITEGLFKSVCTELHKQVVSEISALKSEFENL